MLPSKTINIEDWIESDYFFSKSYEDILSFSSVREMLFIILSSISKWLLTKLPR